jgi:CRISPR/Cas system CSM-associated protein Csm3 (group 7 of RAMP superfamily)
MNQARLRATKAARHLPGPGIINRYWLKGTLTTVSPLHIGTGEMGQSWKKRGAIDAPPGENCNYVALAQDGVGGGDPRESDGRPVALPILPGTSLRGVLRSFLEGLLFPFNTAGRCDVASLSSSEYEIDRGVGQDDIDERREQILADPATPADTREREKLLGERIPAYLREEADLVGFLFGTTHVRGRVSFSAAEASRFSGAEIRTRDQAHRCFSIHTGVSIDPDTGAAADNKLYDVELVRPGVRFDVDIRFTNVRYWELGMVLLALNTFNHPVFPLHVGGLTQHGYGRMRWAVTSVHQLGADEKGKAPPLADWIAGTDPQGTPGRSLEISNRKIPGVKDTADFVRHCESAFHKVMDDVCA